MLKYFFENFCNPKFLNPNFFNKIPKMYTTKAYSKRDDLDNLPLISLTREYHEIKETYEFGEILTAKTFEIVERFCDDNNLISKADWFLQQGVARFSKLPLVRNDTGLVSAKSLLVNEIRNCPILTALWLIFRHPQRSAVIKGQTDTKFRNYCSLVPLIMSAFKKYQNVNYSEWEKSEIYGITDSNLTAAMILTSLPEISVEEILETRDLALTNKTGSRAGIVKSPLTTYNLYIPKDSVLSQLPTLAKIMMCQTWCANPAHRTSYMILNPLNWDEMPEPLVSSRVVKSDSEKAWSY